MNKKIESLITYIKIIIKFDFRAANLIKKFLLLKYEKSLSKETIKFLKLDSSDEKIKNNNDALITLNEYETFLIKFFEGVDSEDRSINYNSKDKKEASKTALKFKMLSELIQILEMYTELSEEWKKARKYCKYKAYNIQTCLNSNLPIIPGGPCENHDKDKEEINEELNKLIKETEEEKRIDALDLAMQGNLKIKIFI